MPDTPALTVTEILVDPGDLKVVCPGCGERAEAWVRNPLGLTDKCDSCGVPFRIPPDLPIKIM